MNKSITQHNQNDKHISKTISNCFTRFHLSEDRAAAIDKRTVGYKLRKLALEKGTLAMQELLKQAKNADIPAKYVLDIHLQQK